MRRILIAAAALSIAGPAAAQQVFTPELDEEVDRAIPRAGQVEAVGAAVDRVVGAVLDVPIGPIVDAVDAADPDSRTRRRGPRDRTLRDMASRDDPHFEDRLRDSIHGATVGVGATMDQIAILAPVVRRSLADMEIEIEAAMRDYRARRDRDRERR
ncbi:hypothetical protein [Allosphingosinicella sp.]|uniref:hypothetical protein n=1 Tax=Allosphingosinicella sp. TaxID=2823234 RepID=UPI002EEA135E